VAIRNKRRRSAASLLQPGETIQSVFCAQTIDAYEAMVSFWILVTSRAFRIVVVTDRRILLCRPGRLVTQIRAVEAEIPRDTQFGNPDGTWWTCPALGFPLYVHRRFHHDVRMADTTLHRDQARARARSRAYRLRD
jgi:hypothetical protein